jgi:Gas vesicle synthesis protein GvpL/GvpF
VNEAGQVVYVYGVVPSAAHPPQGLAGIEDKPVRHVARGDVAAIVSDIAGGPLGRGRDIRAHWRVLDDAVERATVLPLRFGTVMGSDDEVRDEFLAPNEAHLAAQLAELEGKVQLSVKGFYRDDVMLREVVQEAPAIRRLRERIRQLPEAAAYYEMIALGELVAAEVDRHRERDTERVLERLEGLAVASHAERRMTKESAVNVDFLVERDRVDEFSAEVQRLHTEIGDRIRLRYVGPLPPYSFAGEEAGAATWA